MEAKKNGDGTIKKCIKLFKEEASPEVSTKLEKSLRKQLEKSPEKQEEYQKHYKYHIENFLLALKDEVIKSEELALPTVFNNEIEQSQRPRTIRGKIVQTILDITNRSSSVSSIPSVAEENKDPQTENKSQAQLEQAVPEKPQVQKSGNLGGLKGKISSQVEVKLKSKGEEPEPALFEEESKLEEQKKEAVLSEQSAPDNNNNDKEVLSKKTTQ